MDDEGRALLQDIVDRHLLPAYTDNKVRAYLAQSVRPEAARTTQEAEARIFCLEDAVRPFALHADTMYHLKDGDKVCGMYVAWFRHAARMLNDKSTPQLGEPSGPIQPPPNPK